MSIELINKFQNKLYQLINSEEYIRENVRKIYLSVHQKGDFPFICIDVDQIKEISRFENKQFELSLNISLVTKGFTEKAYKITEKIIEVLKQNNISFAGFDVLSIRHVGSEVSQAADLFSSKLDLKYKTLITKGRVL